MPSEHANPGPIMQLATGYWSSATFLAACELGVFGLLSSAALPASEIAAQLGADPRATEMLLDACVGLNLLVKDSSPLPAYSDTPETAAFLTPGRPGFLGEAIGWSADQFAAWGRLAESVRTGAPAAAPALHLGEEPEQTRRFVLGMHRRAMGVAQGLVHLLDFDGISKLLDIGGGSGAYGMLLARKYPAMKVTVLDLPAIVAISAELIAEAGASDRVQVRPADAVTGDYGESDVDGVLFSGVLHQMAPPTVRRMLAGAHRALITGGRIVISDMMLEADKTRPVFSTLFSLQMLLTSEAGAVFSADECADWLRAAGFVEVAIRPCPPPLPYTIVTGRKS